MTQSMNEVREAIKYLKIGFNVDREKDLTTYGKHLLVLLSVAQSFLDAEGEFPKKALTYDREVIEINSKNFSVINGKYNAGWNDAIDQCISVHLSIMAKKDEEIEQLRVQLAGCGVAALGYATGKNAVSKGDYGYSESFGDVMRLQAKYQEQVKEISDLKRKLEENEKNSVRRICSKHQVPDSNCDICKIHFPFTIDTDEYCKSAGYIKKYYKN